MKNRIFFTMIGSLFFFVMISNGQYKTTSANGHDESILTGNIHTDIIINFNSYKTNIDTVTITDQNKRYSPLLAGLFSAVVPGAGQFYTKNYWQSAAFLGAEVLSWILYASYERKGDRQTVVFQKYADDYWSVVRYARWIEIYYGYSANALFYGTPTNDIAQPWKYVDWEKLNSYEDEIGKITHSGFSHKLAPYSDQQYYEMIGKYAQFIGGWNDSWNGVTSLYGTNDVFTENLSPNFLKYRDMRGEANSFYNIATTVSYVIVANHIFSALEAAWNASKINNRISLEGHIQSRNIYGNMVEFVPTLRARYEF